MWGGALYHSRNWAQPVETGGACTGIHDQRHFERITRDYNVQGAPEGAYFLDCILCVFVAQKPSERFYGLSLPSIEIFLQMQILIQRVFSQK